MREHFFRAIQELQNIDAHHRSRDMPKFDNAE